jgi:TRAP-type transport system periplasmic protein
MSVAVRGRRLAVLIALVAVALPLGPPPAIAQTPKLAFRLATETARGEDTALLLEQFKEAAEAQSKGDVRITVFYGGALGNQRQLQEQVQLGTIEAVGTGSDLPEMDARFGVFDFPFLFKDRAHAARVLDGDVGRKLSEGLVRARGVRVLAYGEIGFRQITNRTRPVLRPADLQGLKIRVPSNRIRIAAFKALGAAATPIPYKELYTALQQGVVDGQENPVFSINTLSLWEVQKYVSLTNHVFTPAYLLVNERWWQGLPAEQRQLLQLAAHEATGRQRAILARGEEELLAKLKSRGMQVDTPSLEPFVQATRPVWAEFEEKIGKELVAEIVQLR